MSVAPVIGSCPPPFLEESAFPATGGYLGGRSCGPSPLDQAVNCCLPCPIETWVYPESYLSTVRKINYISVISFALCAFVLLSYLVLPPEKSHRHYLNIGLLCVFVPFHVALIIPLAHRPETCYNAITPRDMHSSGICAVTGAFLSIGGIGAVVWVFLRALWTHLRVCWDVTPGQRFMYASVGSGIVIPAAFLAAIVSATGFSFRLGDNCVPNHDHSFADFWGWMLAFSGLSGIMQLATTGYGLWMYVRSLKHGRKKGQAGTGTSGSNSQSRAGVGSLEKDIGSVGHSDSSTHAAPPTPLTPHSGRLAAWREIRALLIVQWRSICICFLVIVEIVFFTAVFIAQDAKTTAKSGNPQDIPAVQQWSTCLALTAGDRDICRPFTSALVLPQPTVLAALILSALTGTELSALLIRGDTLVAWGHLIRRGFKFATRGKRRGSDLPLTSLAAQPLPRIPPKQQNHQQDDEKKGTMPSGPLAPILEATAHKKDGNNTPKGGDAGSTAGTSTTTRRSSFFRRWSWRRGSGLLNWPLPVDGIRRGSASGAPGEKDGDGINNSSSDTSATAAVASPTSAKGVKRIPSVPPAWATEEDGDGGRVVLDPRAWGRGGLAMNPVQSNASVGSTGSGGGEGAANANNNRDNSVSSGSNFGSGKVEGNGDGEASNSSRSAVSGTTPASLRQIP